MSERYVCIHGHFYQPPRENPWLETVELQDSAYPYHDWNERIAAECYAPMAVSRILDAHGRIVRMVNNYAHISFNFGPTLLSWLERKDPETYRAVLAADEESQSRHGGHGSAIAQAYNHVILPLANRRDKITQVRWGIRDFEHRFDRQPEGMWLPETAADLETLDILAEHGLRFTILAPHQAKRVRQAGGPWEDASGGRVDTRRAYELRLPSGRSIAVFFFDGPASRAVAFEGLLRSGDAFAARLLAPLAAPNSGPLLSHIATDGETYGHHHRYGDMALAYALHKIEESGAARLTNYGELLSLHPPKWEVEIVENASWSCPHGVERWRADCGCNVASPPGWNQSWRAPLRRALDRLRDELAGPFERLGSQLLRDPWAARDDYIEVILDRSRESVDRFLARHSARPLSEADCTAVLKLMELQRHALLMYTSCGWFFDDIAGLEAVQVLRYAGRALHLGEDLFGDHKGEIFLGELQAARSNQPGVGNGRQVWSMLVEPSRVDLNKLVAAYAMSSLFETYGEETRLHCYTVRRERYRRLEAGRARVATGVGAMQCEITQETARLSFAVVHLGDHNLSCGVRTFRGEESFQDMEGALTEAFQRADFAAVIRTLDQHFSDRTYSLRSIFPDMRRRLVDSILRNTLEELETEYRQTYDHHAALTRFLGGLGLPLPRVLHVTAEFVLNLSLRRAFERDYVDVEQIAALLEEARAGRIPLDLPALGFALEGALERLGALLQHDPNSLPILRKIKVLVGLAREQRFEVNLWRAQNRYFELSRDAWPEFRARAEKGEPAASAWLAEFAALGDYLGVKVV